MGGTGSSSAWAWVASGQAAREQQLSRVRKQEQEVSSMAVEDGDGLRLQDDVGENGTTGGPQSPRRRSGNERRRWSNARELVCSSECGLSLAVVAGCSSAYGGIPQ
jgi:hypothetical protein